MDQEYEDEKPHYEEHELSEQFYDNLKLYLLDNLPQALEYLKEISKIIQEKAKENNDTNEVSQFVVTQTGDIYYPDLEQLRYFTDSVDMIPCLVTADEKWRCHHLCPRGFHMFTEDTDGELHSQYPAEPISDSDDDFTPIASQKAKSEPASPLIDPDRILNNRELYQYCCMEYDINEKNWDGPDYHDDCFAALGMIRGLQEKEMMKHCKRTRKEFESKAHQLRITQFKHPGPRRQQTQGSWDDVDDDFLTSVNSDVK